MHFAPAAQGGTDTAPHRSLAQRAAGERIGLFPQALVPLVEEFLIRLDDQLRALGPHVDLDRDQVLYQGALDMADQLSALTVRSLVAEFHYFRADRGGLFEPSSSTTWEAFEATTGETDFLSRLFGRNPVLERLIRQGMDFRVQLLVDTITHLIADRAELDDAGMLPEGTVLRLRVSDGDPHNYGRTVVMLDTTGGTLVHKPRPLGCEQLALDVIALVNPWLGADSRLRLPQVLSRPDHGWQEFVEPGPVEDVRAAARFAYRMGAFSIVFAALGTTDLHFGNVLACGEHPMFVDLETLSQLRSRVDQAHLVDATPRMAVLETGLLPFRVQGSLVDVDISGIGRSDVQESRHHSITLLDHGTDAVRLGTVPATVLQSDNLLHLAGRSVAIRDFETDFAAGLHDALAAVRALQEPLEDLIRAGDFQIRQVLRPTMRYSRLLQAATHPDYLAREAERSRLMNRLPAIPGLPSKISDAVRRLEVLALERGDIPCFVVDNDSHALRGPVDGEVPGVFTLTPADDMIAVLRRFLQSPDELHRYLALASLAATEDTVASTAHDDSPAPGSHFAHLLTPGVAGLTDRVARLLVDLNLSSDREPSWLMPQVTGPSHMGLAPASASLYDGAGIALVLAHGGAENADRVSRILSQPYLDGVAALNSPLGRSVYSGVASSAYLLDEMASLHAKPRWAERRDVYLDSLRDSEPIAGAPRDLIGGICGVLAFVAQPGRPDLVDRHSQLLVKNLPELVGALQDTSMPPHETAHGRAGVAWALARAARAVDDPGALALAADHLRRTLTHVRQQSSAPPRVHDASWCKGYSGALLCTAEGLLLAGESTGQVLTEVEPLIEEALASSDGLGRDLTPCHGVSGTVQVLAHLSRLLGEASLLAQATELFDRRLHEVARIGFNGGLHRSQTSLSYMTGLTGLAHTARILADSRVGVPLALTTTVPSRVAIPTVEGER